MISDMLLSNNFFKIKQESLAIIISGCSDQLIRLIERQAIALEKISDAVAMLCRNKSRDDM